MRHDEVLAHACLAAAFGADRVRRVWPQSNGEHDLDVLGDAGQLRGIVEVTSTVDSIYEGTLAALAGPRCAVPKIQCKGSWRVWPRGDVNVRSLKRQLDSFLFELESKGIEEFDDESDPEIVRSAECLGLENGAREESSDHHVVNLPGRSGRVDQDSLAAAIETVGGRSDNLRKLSSLEVPERHLFVVVEFSALAAYCSFDAAELCRPASVDQRITHVWAARYSSSSSAMLVHAPNGLPWTKRRVSWDHRAYLDVDA